MFCFTLLYVHSSFAIILMGMRELVTLLSLSSWRIVIVVWLFLAVPCVCLQFVIVVFPDHTHLLNLNIKSFVKSSILRWLSLTTFVLRTERKESMFGMFHLISFTIIFCPDSQE